MTFVSKLLNNFFYQFPWSVYDLVYQNCKMSCNYGSLYRNQLKKRKYPYDVKTDFKPDLHDALTKLQCQFLGTVDFDNTKHIQEAIGPFTISYFKQVQSIYNMCDCLYDFMENLRILRNRTHNKLAYRLKDTITKFKDEIEVITDDIMVEFASVDNPHVTHSECEISTETVPSSPSSSQTSSVLSSSSLNQDIKQKHSTGVITFESSDEASNLVEVVDMVVQAKSTVEPSFDFDNSGHVIAYVDGSCSNNGRPNATAGYGVFFSSNSPLNVSAPCRGIPTNNNAEIQAATEAIQIVRKNGFKKIILRTDSQFLIDCMSKWITGWKKKNWINSKKERVKNYDSLIELDALLPSMESVKWEYVQAHKGIIGNEMADKLAKMGCRMTGPQPA